MQVASGLLRGTTAALGERWPLEVGHESEAALLAGFKADRGAVTRRLAEGEAGESMTEPVTCRLDLVGELWPRRRKPVDAVQK